MSSDWLTPLLERLRNAEPAPINVLAAYFAARNGDPKPLAAMLREAGFDELADDFELGDVNFAKGQEGDACLLEAAVAFRELDRGTDWEAVAEDWRKTRPADKSEISEEGAKWKGTADEARSLTMRDLAIKRGVSAGALSLFLQSAGSPYRRLRKYLPEDLFKKVER